MVLPNVAQAAAGGAGGDGLRAAGPSPGLAPATVVQIQLEALKDNNARNDGIALTYAFASPANKAQTGPLARFTAMVLAAPYDRLVNHRSVRYGPIAVGDDEAVQPVTVMDALGETNTYLWILSRQTEGPCTGCWMTDAVIPLTSPAPRVLASLAGRQ
jgi:hypothetical protein